MTSPAPLFGPTPESSRITRANWLGRYLGVEGHFDNSLKSILTDALEGIDEAFDNVKDTFSGKVRKQQLAASRKSTQGIIKQIFGATSNLIKDYRHDAALAAVDAELYEERGILARIFSNPVERQQYADSLRQTASRNVENVVARTLFSERPLSARVYKSEALANHQVSQAINRALARGDSAKELASSVKHMIDPSTPGGISYAAQRLGRTEINNAFHATAIKTSQDVPWVEAMEWHLSKVHENDPGDECEIYAQQRFFDLNLVPDKPHPNCRCYVTPKQQDYDSFENSLLSGHYDNYLDEVLGIEPQPITAQEVMPLYTDRMRAEIAKHGPGKTISPWKGITQDELKALRKYNNHIQDQQWAAEIGGAPPGGRPRITDDHVPQSISKAANAKQVANYLQSQYTGLETEGFDIESVDVRSAREIADGFVAEIGKNPANNLRRIAIGELDPGVNAETNFDGKTSTITFNADSVSDYEAFKAEQQKLIRQGYFSSRNGGVRPFHSTFVHEYGHVLDFTSRARTSAEIDVDRDFAAFGRSTKVPGTFFNLFDPDGVRDINDPATYREYEKWVKKRVSGYSLDTTGAIDEHETVAEAYSEVTESEHPRSIARFLVDLLRENLTDTRILKGPIKKRRRK